jgi:hypothetical protein
VGKVTASLDTSHYKGRVEKSIVVRTGDPGTNPVMLQLKADIVSLIDVTPSETPVVRTTVGAATPTEVTVATTDGKAFDILAVQADASVGVTVQPAPGAGTAGRRVKRSHDGPLAAGSNRYLVTITPKPEVPVGESVANVTLTTNRPKAEKVPIRAFVVVTGPERALPQQ